ncbi:unnamed protein product [Adineta steineri]|uniref:L-xylulose reductase n=1 Tax=Adineta steineri TaxID=433720 RepID=A0A818PIA9_9BILA|nr:unnamed protein product [Adineta steineri]CAF0885859.1 unnamed protein product [Adineta steineri]CAF3625029.1 unnamed protein product [Adineta steineri]CAF3981476.1 unnamed protein product [Adineta steineri]
MAESDFQNKTVCVTGAGRGIGKSLALRLAELGAKVIAVSKSDQNLKQLVAQNNKIIPVCVDLCDWNATKEAIKPHLPIQLLVNNAAVAILDSFLEVKPDDFDSLFNINVKSIICVSQEIARDLIERKMSGSIVNVSSQAASAALKDHSIYCASKAAVDGLTRVMAMELGAHQIRVNSVQPTVVLTDMGRIGWSDEKKAAGMLSKIPLNKFAEVEDVVEPIIFLLSNKSQMINGVSLPIDGGFLAT